jgi:TM2 domain-containing membrane protein YozV
MVVIYLIKTGPLITGIAAVKQSIFLIEDYIIIPIVICFFLQLYSHKKYLFKIDQFYSSSYWVVIALLLYSLDSFSVAVFTIYHITVSIPSEFK